MFVMREDGKIVGAFASEQEFATEELSDDSAELVAFLNPTAPAVYIIPKMVLWTRLSDAEANTVDAAMATQSAKLRGIWNSASEVRSDSEFFGTLEAFLTSVLGADRATQLLQP
ncbi:hypothetical protein DTW90_18435 [Neorhizobium sp. P12A]|uniref:hypothetical protein n=1 Tax=Neorhizobium sp. P12A TaxID=2268027 RepID=UPI0011EF36AF|nr:hypothetical protein [Neorhizobium sp. P12A]KAA0697409.1 hypothetical protein DTW90_18435 [Neorhizobium sp. P12A]